VSDEKKPGLLGRLFGWGRKKDEAPPPEPEKEVATPEAEAEVPVAKKPEPTPAPPEATPPAPEAKEPEAPKAEPKPAAKSAPKPKPTSKPKAKPAPKKAAPVAKTTPKPKPKTEPKPEPKAEPKPKPVEEPAAKAPAPKKAPAQKPAKEKAPEEKPKPAPKTEAPPPPPPEPKPAPPPEPEVIDDADLEVGPPETTPEYIEEHQVEPEPEPAPAPEKKKNWFQRLASGLKRSSDQLTDNISSVFTKKKLDQATLDDLEDILIQADLGVDTALAITDQLAADKFDKEISAEEVREVLAAEVEKVLTPVAQPLTIDTSKTPFVILMVGVNGSGKTTTIGKMAQKLGAEGKKVMLAAGDTFRAAAVEQLQVWGERTGAPVVTRPTGADAAGLAFDALTEARAAGSDVLIIDTAGRLQNRDELMAELEKVIRVIKKVDDTAPHATLLTLDATTGQNALNQVEIFGQRAGVTGLVMTKLDGTARGGILVAIAKKFNKPVHYIGVGESADDLESFAAKDFAEAIAGKE